MLVDLLEKDAVGAEVLRARYGPLLELVRTLIGVVPNCDAYLEIWPPAFRTYNVMVPNFLNLPLLVWGLGAPRGTIGLALYVASRTAGCPYCAAHTGSFALRRGATVEDVANALDASDKLAAPDRAAVRVARAISAVPTELTDADRAELARHFGPAHVEWLVLAVAMMGWLNKTMDALGVPLEASTAAEVSKVISASGWSPGAILREPLLSAAPPPPDSLGTRLGVLRHAPVALRLDKEWTRGVPDRWPAVGDFLRAATGHTFPVLGRLRHGRAIRALATMIRDNLALDLPSSAAPRADKLAMGLVYATEAGDAALATELAELGAKDPAGEPLATLARAVAPSPARVDASVVEACRGMSSAALVELVTFVSLCQLLHRLGAFFR